MVSTYEQMGSLPYLGAEAFAMGFTSLKGVNPAYRELTLLPPPPHMEPRSRVPASTFGGGARRYVSANTAPWGGRQGPGRHVVMGEGEGERQQGWPSEEIQPVKAFSANYDGGRFAKTRSVYPNSGLAGELIAPPPNPRIEALGGHRQRRERGRCFTEFDIAIPVEAVAETRAWGCV